jgi:outer membrane immunogenic protein
MKKLFVAGIAAAAFCGAPALAADIPTKAPVYVGNGPVAVFNWTGFYVGGQVGYGWGNDPLDHTGIFFSNATGVTHPKGFIGGGQIGYNWQSGVWVIGVEASLAGAGLRDKITSPPPFVQDDWSARISSIATATARLGYAMGAWLPYIKGGYAGGRAKSRLECSTCAPVQSAEDSAWHNGWTLGTGIEYMLNQNWTIGLEYAYVNLGSRNHSADVTNCGAPCGTASWKDDPRIHTVMFRVNYKFDDVGKGPVYAKY